MSKEAFSPVPRKTEKPSGEQKGRPPYTQVVEIILFASTALIFSRFDRMWERHQTNYNKTKEQAKREGKTEAEIEDILNRLTDEAVKPLNEALRKDREHPEL